MPPGSEGGSYPALPRALAEQLHRVPPSHDRRLEYRPCAVTLADGRELPCVYVVDAAAYLRVWGVYPERDPAKRAVPLAAVRGIRESSHRLPAALADTLYRAGESGMGYTVFTVEFSDGRRQAYVAGNAVDFIAAPPGLWAADAVRVRPHEGREAAPLPAVDYHWCLYDGVETSWP